MKNAKRFSLLAIISSLLSVYIVQAATFDLVNKKLKWIFFDMSGSSAFEIWLKFAFFVILFAALYNAGLRISKDNKPMQRAIAVITVIISLISAIFVPYKLLLYIFKMYYVILVVLFALLPPFIGYIICNKILKEDDRMHRFIRAIIYILITIFIMGLVGEVQANSSPDTKLFEQVLEPLVWGAIIALIAGFWNLIMAIGGDKVPGWLGGNQGQQQGRQGGQGQGQQQQGGTTGGGAAPTPPAPNPADIQRLQTQIQNFVRAVGDPPTAGTGSTGLHTNLEAAVARYNTDIHGAPNDPARRAAAPGHMPALTTLHNTLENQRRIMDATANHPQYPNVPEVYRQAFEGRVGHLLNIERNFTALYNGTIRWL
ncbi:hypothetical protein COV16_03550 [Candidatus Woesearchaeota archaeon CG10_big_fil_rev_8_21_14_0_10_34_8]|nr:MAG: hypothetical protein COV16_03550 [Candidatus Woesearchaeota archaeon CG10_big_fil_rev_8_21_14_0_10_34_8]